MSITKVRPTPSVTRVQKIQRQIAELEDERTHLLERVVADAEFMDIPVRKIRWGFRASDDPIVGDTWHVLTSYSEADDGTEFFGHSAENCPGHWCASVGEPRRPKYQRAGSRWWFTFLGEHVYVGPADASDRPDHIFIPVES